MSRRRGFTLIELLVVVTIIGIIVAIASVNLINAIQRAKQKRSMADMKTASTAVEAYATDQNYYPAAAALTLPSGLSLPTVTIGAVAGSIAPTYMRAVPLVDGWSSFFLYGASTSRSDYAVSCMGADGVPEASPAGGVTTNFNSDIILVDGTFVQFPEGVQR